MKKLDEDETMLSYFYNPIHYEEIITLLWESKTLLIHQRLNIPTDSGNSEVSQRAQTRGRRVRPRLLTSSASHGRRRAVLHRCASPTNCTGMSRRSCRMLPRTNRFSWDEKQTLTSGQITHNPNDSLSLFSYLQQIPKCLVFLCLLVSQWIPLSLFFFFSYILFSRTYTILSLLKTLFLHQCLAIKAWNTMQDIFLQVSSCFHNIALHSCPTPDQSCLSSSDLSPCPVN